MLQMTCITLAAEFHEKTTYNQFLNTKQQSLL